MRYSSVENLGGGSKPTARKSMKLIGQLLPFVLFALQACSQGPEAAQVRHAIATIEGIEFSAADLALKPGIFTFVNQLGAYKGKRLAVVANHTSTIEGVHLVDTLLASGMELARIFAPEHGFRGDVADGMTVKNQLDQRTGLSIVSLYGKNKKPSAEQLSDVDVVIFDIQDVGARFYTFLSTLHYVMESCAELKIPMLVLDRPNPNIHYVDGPLLQKGFSSFVGLHPVPVVYGLTIGEYAMMLNGEKLLKNGVQCQLQVVPCANYSRTDHYTLPIAPSPNLPNMEAIYLYPSLCFFEGTTVSVGRGTSKPFAAIGEPGNRSGNFRFTPVSMPGISDNPPHKGKECVGYNLAGTVDLNNPPTSLNIEWLLRMYNESADPGSFFLSSGFFDKLAGTDALRKSVIAGSTVAEIRASWQNELAQFEQLRRKYFIYPE